MGESRYKDVKKWRHSVKERLFLGFGGYCGCCKQVEHYLIYDFHHLDPSQKEFVITGQIRSWTVLMEEAKKCAMLCPICHRKHHAGLIELPTDMPRFDESRIPLAINQAPQSPCPVCGTMKSNFKATCSSICARDNRRKLRIPGPELQKLFDDTGSYVGVARILGVSDKFVRKHLTRYQNRLNTPSEGA